jgi:hypothetical protein
VPENHVALLETLAVPRTRGPNGQAYFGVVFGLANDLLTEGAALALRSGSLYDVNPHAPDRANPIAPEALELIGRASLLPLYPGEAIADFLTRLRARWDFWQSSPKETMAAELEAAGYGTPVVTVPGDYDPLPDSFVDYWSRFWVTFGEGEHIVTGPTGFVMGTNVMGDRWGPEGIASADGARWLALLKSIIKRHKPSQWIVWNFEFELGGGEVVRIMGKPRTENAGGDWDDPDFVPHTP